jgi:alcohol dehydrogenase class IV
MLHVPGRPTQEAPMTTPPPHRGADAAAGRTEETIFTWGAPPLKFGPGAVDEIGFEMTQFGARRVLVITDATVHAAGIPQRIADSLRRYDVEVEIFDGVHVEPTDESMDKAAGYARAQGPWDGFVAVGGGSAIDTAKAVNLLTTDGGELMDYLNRPIGEGRAPSGALKPLVAVPTTAGTGSESTATCVLDVLSMKVKTGMSHWRLRPALAVVDPLLTLTLPPEVTAASGMDIVCHAVESYTARWYRTYDRKAAEDRVTYCGANPVSDLWCERAMGLLAESFRTAVRSGDDVEARSRMMMAATFAGMGFGNAGVHIPHANAYPIAGMVKDYRPAGYPQDEPMVPHGQSVSLTAPEAFRFSFEAAPERHLRAAALLGPATERRDDPREQLPAVLVDLMRDIGIPNGIGAVGYTEDDVPELVPGTMKQQRLLSTCPRPVTEEDIAGILTRSVENW